MHAGVSPITVKATTWLAQHQELWEMLIPSQGPAKTMQGEVIRITGKIAGELYRNGGANWSMDFRKMLNALVKHLASENALERHEIEEATALAKQINSNSNDDEMSRL